MKQYLPVMAALLVFLLLIFFISRRDHEVEMDPIEQDYAVTVSVDEIDLRPVWDGAIRQTYGITVIFDQVHFPRSWRMDGSATFARVPRRDQAAALEALSIGLRRYPPDLIRRHLHRVYILDRLAFKGVAYGGTYDFDSRAVYIRAGWLGGEDKSALAMVFHHEFSSILLHAFPRVFSRERWRRLNPPGFEYRYPKSSWESIAHGSPDKVGNDFLHSQGFVCGYGQNSLEDDINTFAEFLVGKPERLRALADEYPAIALKAELLRDYYRQVGYAE